LEVPKDVDTVIKDIIVYDKPPITIPFRDTLICGIDTLALFADGFGQSPGSPGIIFSIQIHQHHWYGPRSLRNIMSRSTIEVA
jgi:hypothetical protein